MTSAAPPSTLLVEVCICTKNPRRDVLGLVLRALGRQSLAANRFAVLVIDNASSPALRDEDLGALGELGVAYRLMREPRPGVAFARAAGIRSTAAPLILFVDDDNELDPDYLAVAVALAEAHPDEGCIGGQLLPAIEIPRWFLPLASFFALDPDGFDRPRSGFVEYRWTNADPPTAGLLVRREIAERFLGHEHEYGSLGRTPGEPASVEDALLTREAHRLGFKCARRPELRLKHHVDPARFTLRNALRFFYSHGGAHVRLGRILGVKDAFVDESFMVARSAARAIVGRADPRTAACLVAWEAGRRATYFAKRG